MQPSSPLPPKPFAQIVRPHLTRLPEYTLWRCVFRLLLWVTFRVITTLSLKLKIQGLKNFPRHGPALIALNHLGDTDIVLILSHLPTLSVDPLAASDLFDLGWQGSMINQYGAIFLHRGHPDRRAMTCAIESLARGRFVSIAPEGRESLTEGLEEGLSGAAFLACKADVPIVPIAVTGTENKRVFPNMKRLRRTPVTLTVGQPFRIAHTGDRRADLKNGTERIMRELARLLPPEYQGIYREG